MKDEDNERLRKAAKEGFYAGYLAASQAIRTGNIDQAWERETLRKRYDYPASVTASMPSRQTGRVVFGREIKVCQTHKTNHKAGCWSCDFAIDWVCIGQFCHCGEKATGYRAMAADLPLEFFCNAHWEDVPQTSLGATTEVSVSTAASEAK